MQSLYDLFVAGFLTWQMLDAIFWGAPLFAAVACAFTLPLSLIAE